MPPHHETCSTCPVIAGECYPRRSGRLNLCRAEGLRERISQWGSVGGPIEGPPPIVEPLPELDSQLAWFASQPPEFKARIEACPSRSFETNVGCCNGDGHVCRGGSRDGQVVKILDCAECIAPDLEGIPAAPSGFPGVRFASVASRPGPSNP